MGDAVRFDKLEQIGKVKRVTTVFIPGKTNGQVWYTTFKAKADAGNLNVNEKKLLLVGHFEDPDLILWWNENSASATTSDEVDTLFLEAHGSTGVTQAHAVYGMADVRLNLGDDYDKFVERFVDVYIQANPNRRRNDRISSFINALYPELREELEIEQIYTDWDQLKRRVGYLHAKQHPFRMDGPTGVQQRDERDELAELRKRLDQQAAQIAALRGRGRGHVDRPTVGLSAVGQTGVSVVGEITAKFSHPSLLKKVFPYHLTITEDSGYEAVLGQDFLKLLDPVVQYHYREDRLDVADLSSFKVWYEDGRKPMHVSAFTCTKVPKRARALVRVQVEGMEGEETVILRRNYPRGFPGLTISDQVVDVKAGVATVEVMNIATNLIRLGPNSLLTFAEPFSRVSSVAAVTANAPASAYT
uniref:Uncharacterized protein n=1 Tax=Chromera velia CCMP2878 TaxID=1169474 RepID=A0A0G4I5T9_9ALVE|eukprot:Cvel_81.t1-p1 / transcript=Cvel_81.t1 / gene=Cvel_81 / organism=Chromera_velia_CCMP2878 / gene_product=hypothetical protein / transcript_product=hypothetical protein / location=Cvel_scaffold6:232822-234707(-) / protein_length=415 / sequence_SO=supercontig / SO=protein_coding / is_pseudo=false